jgi:cell division septation protein DedD
MKITRIIALATILITFLTGCDAIRSALGKPTSKDIAALRAQKAQMQRTGDSLAVEMGALPDSLDVEASLAAEAAAPDSASTAEIHSLVGTAPDLKQEAASPEQPPQQESDGDDLQDAGDEGLAPGFYVVLGSFKNPDNAQYYYNSLSASGADVHLVKMKNGFTAVMICHGATYDESYSKMQDFYRDKKKPEDIWIYNTAKKLHLE